MRIQSYFSLRQYQNETLVAYRERMVDCMSGFETVKIDRPPDADQASHFLLTLDKARFSGMNAFIQNSVSAGMMNYPKTLVAAMKFASNYVRIGDEAKENSMPAAVLVSAPKKKEEKGKLKEKKKESSQEDVVLSMDKPTKEHPHSCHRCKLWGHYSNRCPLKEVANAKDEVLIATTTYSLNAERESYCNVCRSDFDDCNCKADPTAPMLLATTTYSHTTDQEVYCED